MMGRMRIRIRVLGMLGGEGVGRGWIGGVVWCDYILRSRTRVRLKIPGWNMFST
jgi:hypothetical protein